MGIRYRGLATKLILSRYGLNSSKVAKLPVIQRIKSYGGIDVYKRQIQITAKIISPIVYS